MRGLRNWVGRRASAEGRRPSMLAVEAFGCGGMGDRYAEMGAQPPAATARAARARSVELAG